jgi:SAM-dependent methyltransferase
MTDEEAFDRATHLDWSQAWRAGRARTKQRWDGRSFWNSRAASFATHARESGYCRDVLTLLQPRPDWTVLDVGCGAGTLALPLAPKVKSVTALDISDGMLGILGQRCAEQGITNIRPVLAGWEDDWHAAGVPAHDVVLASRSLFPMDLAAAIDKLMAFSSKRVLVVSLVDDGPYDREVFQAVGRPLYRGPDYRFVTNYLAQIGIHADVTFIREVEDKTYATLDDAVQGTRWMLDGITPEEEIRLRNHLELRCVRRPGGVALPKPRVTHWAAIGWERS